MFSLGNHDMEHERLLRLTNILISRGTWANRPTVPLTDQVYQATDRNNEEYYWFPGSPVGTNANWLSTKVYEVELRPTAAVAQPQTFAAVAAANTHRGEINNFKWSTSYVVDNIQATYQVAATFDATHYFQINYVTVSAAGAVAITYAVVTFTTGFVAATIYSKVAAGSLTTVFTSTTAPVWRTDLAVTGTPPGAITIEGISMWIRLVG